MIPQSLHLIIASITAIEEERRGLCAGVLSCAFITDQNPRCEGGVRVGEIMRVFREKRRWFQDFGPALTVAIVGGALSIIFWHLVVALETQLFVQVTPAPGGFTADGHWLSLIVLIFGLLLSGGMTFIIHASGRHARDLEIKNLQFDAALNNMVQGLLMYDPAGHLIISNRRFAEIYGMPWEKWSPACLGTTVPEGIKLADSLANVTTKNPTQLVGEIQSILSRRKPGAFVIERSDGRTYASTNAPMADGGYVVTLMTSRKLGVMKKRFLI
jgi:PAS domain-containing protein